MGQVLIIGRKRRFRLSYDSGEAKPPPCGAVEDSLAANSGSIFAFAKLSVLVRL
jgi:hypothetical protein